MTLVLKITTRENSKSYQNFKNGIMKLCLIELNSKTRTKKTCLSIEHHNILDNCTNIFDGLEVVYLLLIANDIK